MDTIFAEVLLGFDLAGMVCAAGHEVRDYWARRAATRRARRPVAGMLGGHRDG